MPLFIHVIPWVHICMSPWALASPHRSGLVIDDVRYNTGYTWLFRQIRFWFMLITSIFTWIRGMIIFIGITYHGILFLITFLSTGPLVFSLNPRFITVTWITNLKEFRYLSYITYAMNDFILTFAKVWFPPSPQHLHPTDFCPIVGILCLDWILLLSLLDIQQIIQIEWFFNYQIDSKPKQLSMISRARKKPVRFNGQYSDNKTSII